MGTQWWPESLRAFADSGGLASPGAHGVPLPHTYRTERENPRPTEQEHPRRGRRRHDDEGATKATETNAESRARKQAGGEGQKREGEERRGRIRNIKRPKACMAACGKGTSSFKSARRSRRWPRSTCPRQRCIEMSHVRFGVTKMCNGAASKMITCLPRRYWRQPEAGPIEANIEAEVAKPKT